MKKRISQQTLTLFFLTLSTLFCHLLYAQTGFSAYVVDYQSGRALYEHSIDEPRYPASLTKVMTLYLIFEDVKAGKINFNTPITFSTRAANVEPSKLGVQAGESIPLKLAIDALIIKSANDVAIAVAEALSGSESAFIKRMNEKAKQLGMKATTFYNPHGLFHSQQITTAKDMVTLGIAIFRDFPHYYHYFKTDSFYHNGTVFKSHNRVTLNVLGTDGLKTGYIRKSGFNLLSTSKRDGKRVFAVVLGGRTTKIRDDIMADLLNASFNSVREYRPTIDYTIVMDQTVLFKPEKGVTENKTVVKNVTSQGPVFTASPKITMISQAQNTASPTKESLAVLEDHLLGDAVQVGAFQDYETAQTQATLTKRRTGIDRISIVHQEGLYKVWVTGFTTEEAYTTCDLIKSFKGTCFVVKNPEKA